jgi:hypothetical protein
MNKTNKVACFYTELTKNHITKKFTEQCFPLIEYWKQSWESNGWEVHVLTEDYIKDEKYYTDLKFDNFSESVLCQYSIDFDCEYTRACYMRWLAYYKFAKQNGFMYWADYDVVNYGFSPDNQIEDKNFRLSSCSCAGKLNVWGARKILETFIDIQKGEYEPKTLAKLINTHSEKSLADKFSDMMVTAKLVKFPVYHPLVSRLPNEIVLKELRPPFIVHYHNGIFTKPNPNTKHVEDVSHLLHNDGKRSSRLQAIKILEKYNNIKGYTHA